MKRKKNKTLRRTLGFIALALVVALLTAMPLLASGKAPEEEYPLSVLSAQAQRRQIGHFLCGGGTLQQEEGTSVTVPPEVKLTEFLVRNGDTVRAGDPIARVDRVSVMSAIAQVQESMDQVVEDLEKERKASGTQNLQAPGGTVKKVYAETGDSVADVMLEHGALAVVSLDGLMALSLETECSLAAGDKVLVTLGEQTLEGTVKLYLDGTLTVTVPDEGYEEGQTAVLSGVDGTHLGEAPLYIHAPWHAVAYSGTVGAVYAKEGSTLYPGATVLTLKDMGYSAEYRALAQKHRDFEEQMFDLFLLYQSLTLTAPCDGVVSGIDEHSPQLLYAGEGWQVTLLANEPVEGGTEGYYNFVGQVLYCGEFYILRMNPQTYPVDDYAAISGIPLTTEGMTELVETASLPTVYRWRPPESTQTPTETQPPSEEETEEETGETTEPSEPETEPEQGPQNGNWETSGYTAGGIYLFSGDASGDLVWAIEVGYSELPELELPGMPSFGGFTTPGYGGFDGQQPEPPQGPQEVEVALVTPGDTMTVDIVIDELDLHKVALGQQVTVTVDALVGLQCGGTVTKISQAGINTGGSSKFTVTVTLPREADMLPGMNAAVTIPLGSEEGIAVPLAAIYQQENRTLVYTARDEKTGEPASPVAVKTGASDGEYVLVMGLEEGATVWYGYYEALETGIPMMPQMPPVS